MPFARRQLAYLMSAAGDGDGGGASGGNASADKQFSQADLDRILGERLGKTKDQLSALTKERDETKSALAQLQSEMEKIREEGELKGKSEIEKLQHQISKLTEGSKKSEAEWAKKIGEHEAVAQRATADLLDYVKRSHVSQALTAAGVVSSAAEDALDSFLRSAEVELNEKRGIARVLVGGKSFESPVEAAKHFLKEKPHFATPAQGGSGAPRFPGTGGQAPAQDGGVVSLLGAGMAKRNAG